LNTSAGVPGVSSLDAAHAEARHLWPPLILSVLAVWVVPMGSSMGLDESGNWWVIKDGISAMLQRADLWSGGQSVLFNLVVMGTRQVAGDSDFVLRLPSLLMMLATLVLIHRIALRWAGPLAAAFSCLAFVTMREVIHVASVLRPFAMGILLATGAMLALIRWLDRGRFRDAAVYTILAALTPYANYLHGSMFLVHAIYAGMRMYRKDTLVKPAAIVTAWAACGLMLIPLLRQALALYSRRGQALYLSPPNLEQAAASIAPPLLLGAMVLALCLYLLTKRAPLRIADADPDLLWVAALWAIIPPLTLIALGIFTDIQVFAGRYYVVNAPGAALLAGMLLRSLDPPKFGRALALTVAICATLYYGFQEGFLRGLFDYRGAAEDVAQLIRDPGTPVVVVAGYTESNYLPNMTDPLISQALLAPALRYHTPGRLIPAPGMLTPEAEGYMERLFTETLQHQPKFVLTGLLGAEFYRAWLAGRAASSGFRMRSRTDHSGVLVMEFETDGARQ